VRIRMQFELTDYWLTDLSWVARSKPGCKSSSMADPKPLSAQVAQIEHRIVIWGPAFKSRRA